tara:strand:- start:70 stop:531 length:462 start_codon:yes stop_codon:yes gene_type:complete
MSNKIFNFVFLILLFLLQSCSGGQIANFLESSFKNNYSNKISQNDINKQSKSEIISKDKVLLKKKDKITKIKSNDDIKPLNIANSSLIKSNNENTISKENYNYNAQSYRVFVILNKVDPSFPTENFSKVLRNGDINFVIEKIELIPELNQSKK